MFGGSNVPSLSDIAAVTGNGNNNGWGDGNGWWVLIILFALFGGWGNGAWGGGGNGATQGALTRGDLCMDMNFSQLENSVRSLGDGLCSLGYDQLGQMNNMSAQMAAGFAGVDNAICTLGYNNAQLANQANIVALQNQNALQALISQCCCDMKSLFAQAEYNRATDTCAITRAIQDAARDIIQNDNCNYRQLHDEQIDIQMQQKDAQIAQLTSALNGCNTQNVVNAAVQSVVNQVRPTAGPAWIVPNPNANYNFGNFSYGNACGCCGGNNYNVA